MTKIHQPHDKIFKSSLQYPEVAKEFLEMHLPEKIKKIIDWQQIKYCNASFINSKFSAIESDVLLETKLLATQENCYIYFLLEHQSKDDTFMALRLVEYMVNIWQHLRKKQKDKLPLPLIFPLVFFTGKSAYNKPLAIWDLCGTQAPMMQDIWTQPFSLIDVNNIPSEQLKAKPWAGTLVFLMSNYFKQHFEQGLKFIIENLNYLAHQPNDNYLLQLLAYISINDKQNRNIQELLNILKNELSPVLENKIMNLAEHIKAEGIQEGKLQIINEMIKNGVEVEFIAKYTNSSVDEIKKLIQK